MKSKMDRRRYYELTDMRSGIPLHAAKRFLAKHIDKGAWPLMNRSAVVSIVMKHAFMVRDSKKFYKWRATFQICMNWLFMATRKDKVKFLEFFDIMHKELMHFQANLQISHERMENLMETKMSMRKKYIGLMKVYTDLYEGYYKCIVSVFTIAKRILNNKSLPENIQDYIHEDPINKIDELKTDDDGCAIAAPELCDGCNKNLRNSINHEHWSIKNDILEMWDWNTRTKRKTWQETYNLESLKEIVNILEGTVDAMILAVILHSYDFYKGISGLLVMSPGDYELEGIKHILEDTAIEFGLFLNDCELSDSDGALSIHLYIPKNYTIEQVTDIIEGPPTRRFFAVPICVVERKVFDMIMNLLTIVAGPLQTYSRVYIKVSDESTGEIGNFNVSAGQLINFGKNNSREMEDIFTILKSHSIRMTMEGPSMPVSWSKDKDKEMHKKILDTWKKANS